MIGNRLLSLVRGRVLGRLRARRNQRLRKRLGPAVQGGYDPDGDLLVISHDAHLAGAQRILLSLLAEWQRRRPFRVRIVCVDGGVLRADFEQLGPTLVLSDYAIVMRRDAAIADFTAVPLRAIYSSTVVNGLLLHDLRALGVPIITHCHELQASIERWAPGAIMTQTLINSDLILGACDTVAQNLSARHTTPTERLRVVYEFIDFWNADRAPGAEERSELRAELGLTLQDIVVFGCGTTDWRKGPDIFLSVALAACGKNPRLKFIWIGGEREPREFQRRITAAGLDERIRYIGIRSNARRYFYVGEIFALTSREDPCALVAMEAANARLPVVSFSGAGDIPQVLGPEAGAVVAFGDVPAFEDAVLQLARSKDRRQRAGNEGHARIKNRHTAAAAALEVERMLAHAAGLPRKPLGRGPGAPLVTVIIPSYNHAPFLKQRLDSVAGQHFRDLEILVLDDASTDDSLPLLEEFVVREPRARLIYNEHNSGSAFRQWRKGLAMARGKYVWIAESDDSAKLTFLTKTVRTLEGDPSLILAHTQSRILDVDGKSLGRPDSWLNDLALGRWQTTFAADGHDEIREYLSQKNTILNASAVLFRNFPGIESLVDEDMTLCADWLFWIRLLARGRYAFLHRELSYWRLYSSNARDIAPGRLEWEEGQRVLAEAAKILGLNESSHAQIVERLNQRCRGWAAEL